MSILKERLENIFYAEVVSEPVVGSLGLCAEFKSHADISSIVSKFRVEGCTRFKFRSPELCALTEEFGVISLTNAFMQNSANLSLSGSNPSCGIWMQDPFHVDPIDGITLLQKDKDRKRLTPTDYAYADDVRKAISLLKGEGLSDEVISALGLMQGDDFQFSLDGLELELREIIQKNMPDFNEAVFSLIPSDRKFRKCWTSDHSEVVLHSNKPNYIVHGRPTGADGLNNLIGMQIQP